MQDRSLCSFGDGSRAAGSVIVLEADPMREDSELFAHSAQLTGLTDMGPDAPKARGEGGFFIFIFFKNIFLQKYIFSFTFYSFIPLPPGRGAAGTYI